MEASSIRRIWSVSGFVLEFGVAGFLDLGLGL